MLLKAEDVSAQLFSKSTSQIFKSPFPSISSQYPSTNISTGFVLQALSVTELTCYNLSQWQKSQTLAVQDQANNILSKQIIGMTPPIFTLLLQCCARNIPLEMLICLKQEYQGLRLLFATPFLIILSPLTRSTWEKIMVYIMNSPEKN